MQIQNDITVLIDHCVLDVCIGANDLVGDLVTVQTSLQLPCLHLWTIDTGDIDVLQGVDLASSPICDICS